MHATRLTDARRALAHLRLAMASGDPEGLVEQLTDLRDPDRTTNRRRVSWGVSGAVRRRARCAAVRRHRCSTWPADHHRYLPNAAARPIRRSIPTDPRQPRGISTEPAASVIGAVTKAGVL